MLAMVLEMAREDDGDGEDEAQGDEDADGVSGAGAAADDEVRENAAESEAEEGDGDGDEDEVIHEDDGRDANEGEFEAEGAHSGQRHTQVDLAPLGGGGFRVGQVPWQSVAEAEWGEWVRVGLFGGAVWLRAKEI
jgi:hypothetical protein